MSSGDIEITPIANAFASAPQAAIPLVLTTEAQWPTLLDGLTPVQQHWARATGFEPTPGRMLLLPEPEGALAKVIVGIDPNQPLWQLADLPDKLPDGIYSVVEDDADTELRAFRQLGWALGALAADKPPASQSTPPGKSPRLLVQPHEQVAATRLVEAIAQVRRLVNLPANLLGPVALAAVVRNLAQRHAAQYSEWVGDSLLAAGFELVHAVGRSGAEPPRVAKLEWGNPAAPHVVLIGKGVCFDSGGLDMKPAAGMRLMKKDMGGAAHAIALAQLIMQADLPVRLTLLVPAVENSVGPQAFRPGDVIRAGNGKLIEIENTDAEGRLILADSLHHAVRDCIDNAAQAPALVIDMATLTGAARVALGPELPALFSNNDAWASELAAHAERELDPLWRLPLWAPYRRFMKSTSADTMNASNIPMAGAITAALFLEDFVPPHVPWLHLDLYAWNQEDRPGRPKGGEAQTLRALFSLLSERFSTN